MRSGKYLVLSRNRSLHVCWARICRKSWRDVKNGLKSVVDSCANSFSNPMPLSTVPIHPNLSQTTLVDGSVQLVSITMKPWSTIMYFWSKLWINAISIKNSEKKIKKTATYPLTFEKHPPNVVGILKIWSKMFLAENWYLHDICFWIRRLNQS